ncbi:MAG: 4-diphosphocytidyl-2-C-methyl-D-erythritol kinase [Gaiellaceae bacterium]|nr:4-diphosphocytidyl-2-C-methyl-D-erythritol kinase [Gaiellaceae bacterium]
MLTGPAPAKLNLALVVGPVRADGKHELLTVFQRVDLGDRLWVEPADQTTVEGFTADTIVRAALAALPSPHGWRVRLEKNIPVAAGLGGGSSDAATALRLANAQLASPLAAAQLHAIAAQLGADVPFFLADGPQLGSGDGSVLEPVEIPQDFVVLLVLPEGATKQSTASVYATFDARGGADGFDGRAAGLRAALGGVERARDLAALPGNDLASSPLAEELRALGAFRADVSGAGPVVYSLFQNRGDARRAEAAIRARGRCWITVPAWYG